MLESYKSELDLGGNCSCTCHSITDRDNGNEQDGESHTVITKKPPPTRIDENSTNNTPNPEANSGKKKRSV